MENFDFCFKQTHGKYVIYVHISEMKERKHNIAVTVEMTAYERASHLRDYTVVVRGGKPC